MTTLDRLLASVQAKKHEVTIDTQGLGEEQRARIIAAARARGLSAACDGRFILVRDLRGM